MEGEKDSNDSKKNDHHIEVDQENENIEENANGFTEDHDELDVFGSTFYKEQKKNPRAVMPVPKEALFYNMSHKNRGIAVILNHEIFMPNMKLKVRTGTSVDSENLKRCLHRLGFTVQSYDDLTVEGVDKVVEKVSQEDHSDSDCFVLACLSHGEQGILYANDNPYKPEMLWRRFTADKCPSLAGKPKLFFIQACQGDRLDGGVTLYKPTQVDSNPSYKIPTHADFLIAYSTIPGFLSWRHPSQGSWFIEALCEKLNKYGFTVEMLTILTLVSHKVAVYYESYVPDDSVMHSKKQIPSTTCMLTRLLKFSPNESSYKVN